MSTVYHLPSSIEGIKRLAKSLKRQRGIPHMQALDVAAREVGYQNLQHAKNALAVATTESRSHLIYVTSYWRDSKSTAEGRETMTWPLSRPLRVLAPNGFHGFRLDAPDHLEERGDRDSAERARESVLRIIRHLQFADAACVRPWAGASIRDFEWTKGIPQKDHMTLWQHLETGAFLFADEPYCEPQERLQERRAWAHEDGRRVVVAAPTWAGMYLPGDSTLLLAARKEDELVLGRVVEALGRALAPAISWRGESVPYHPTFASPARVASGMAKRSRAHRLPSGTVRKGARLVGSLPDHRWWRPNATMPLAGHVTAARTLNAASAWVGRARSEPFRKHIRAIRDDLDLWFGQEFRGLGTAAELYYGRVGANVVLEQPPDLQGLRALIVAHYPASSPRERVLRHIDAAMTYVARRIGGGSMPSAGTGAA